MLEIFALVKLACDKGENNENIRVYCRRDVYLSKRDVTCKSRKCVDVRDLAKEFGAYHCASQ